MISRLRIPLRYHTIRVLRSRHVILLLRQTFCREGFLLICVIYKKKINENMHRRCCDRKWIRDRRIQWEFIYLNQFCVGDFTDVETRTVETFLGSFWFWWDIRHLVRTISKYLLFVIAVVMFLITKLMFLPMIYKKVLRVCVRHTKHIVTVSKYHFSEQILLRFILKMHYYIIVTFWYTYTNTHLPTHVWMIRIYKTTSTYIFNNSTDVTFRIGC